MKIIWSIQYLRFIVCLMVVTLHLSKKISLSQGNSYYEFYGAAGVDIFFIISGFIMSHESKREKQPREFIKKRLIRIYPIYLATIIPYIMVFLTFPQMVNSHSSESPSILKSLTLIPFIHGSMVNMVVWILSYELFFYLIYSFSLALNGYSKLTTSIIIFSSIIIGRVLNIDFLNSPILIEFLIGMLIYKTLYDREVKNHISKPLILLGILGIVMSSPNEIYGVGFDRLFKWGIPAAILFTGFILLKKVTPKIKLLSNMGNASYSTYLTHIITINIAYQLSEKIGLNLHYSWITVLIGISISFIVGCIIHIRLENLIMKKIKKYR